MGHGTLCPMYWPTLINRLTNNSPGCMRPYMHLIKLTGRLPCFLLDGFSYKEMAAILGISVSNVGVKINRIKKQLIIQSKNSDHGI